MPLLDLDIATLDLYILVLELFVLKLILNKISGHVSTSLFFIKMALFSQRWDISTTAEQLAGSLSKCRHCQ